MNEPREPRDPRSVHIEFPQGRKLRSSGGGSGSSKPLAFFVAGLLLGAIALGAGYYLGGGRTGGSPPPDGLPTSASIDIKNLAFVPKNVTVAKGATVTWTNRDATFHTVTGDAAGSPLSSPSIQPAESWSFTFTENGTYEYHCAPHPFMTAVIIVGSGQGGGGGTPIDLPHQWRDAATSPPASGWHEWNLTLRAKEVYLPVADGVPYAAWTFDGILPGPAFRVRQGDRVNIELINEGTMLHSIDFHSAQIDWLTAYADVAVGGRHTYSFVANYPGVFMYHCGAAPVLAHVANGMYGMMIVDPLNETRPAPQREYALVLSEVYASDRVNASGVFLGDYDKMLAATPTQVVFNGYAWEYHPLRGGTPLTAQPGERVRLYVLNAGPSIVESFHVIGGIFDRIWIENNPNNPLEGIQTWTLPSSGGAAFDIVFPDPGAYPFVTHNFAYTLLGAIGAIVVQ